MWLKEEFLGLEECFKMTHLILDFFCKAMLEGRDSSIEQYLLNFWTKELSLRDLVDRIHTTVRFAPELNSEVFNILFSWLVNSYILCDNPVNWCLDDFRKIATLLAQNIIESKSLQIDSQEMSFKFLSVCSKKFGAKKVRDFMEIQLIQENDLLIKFLDIFDDMFAESDKQYNTN